MRIFWLPVHVCIVIIVISGGCGGNRPLKEPTLIDEATRYAGSFEKNMRLGRYQLALSDARRALLVNRILDRDDPVAVSLNNLGAVQERLQMTGEATASYNEAIEVSRKIGAGRTLAVSLNNMAGMLVEADPVKAEFLAHEAFEIGRDNAWKGIMARAVHVRARVALEKGDVVECAAYCEEALAYASDARDMGIRAACLITLSRAKALEGDQDAALRLAREALAIDRDQADPYAIAMDYSRLAEIQEMSGDINAAQLSRDKALEILDILGVTGDRIMVNDDKAGGM